MKVALVNPNYDGSLESKRAYIPLGLAYIAAVLKESQHELKVIDAAALDLSNEEVEKQLREFKAEVVGTCAVSDLLEAALNVCKISKKLGIKTVIGGVHPTILPYETLSFDEVDIVVIGEGEYTFLELLNFMEKGKKLGGVKGIMFKEKNKAGEVKFVRTKAREPIKNLDELPFPARELFPWKLYSSYSSIVRKVPCMHMMTSRGCPFHCTFCASQSLWKRCSYRSAKSIVDEIEHLIKKFGIREIYLFDDTFNLNLKRSEEICDEIIKRKIKISLRVQARVYPMTKQLLEKMKKAGVWCIYYGVESGNEEVLRDIKKSIRIDVIKKVFKMTEETGIRTFGFFMIGLPKDTRKTIQDTVNLALELNPDFVNFTILVVYPGTEIYELAVKQGSIKRIKAREIFRPPRYTHPLISDEEMQQELAKIYKKIYIRPSYMIRRLLRIRTLTELKANIMAGLPFLKAKNNPFSVAKKWIPVE